MKRVCSLTGCNKEANYGFNGSMICYDCWRMAKDIEVGIYRFTKKEQLKQLYGDFLKIVMGEKIK